MNKNGITPVVVGILFLVAVGAGAGYSLYDQDGDGLRNYEEWTGKSSFTNADTDDDGLQDGAEVNEYGTNPLVSDYDYDGLEDGAEVNEHGTDPTKADTDDDGLQDDDEVNKYDTDPAKADTDDDGLKDSEEVSEWSITFEVSGSSVEEVTKNVTSDPSDSDTDDDGLDDDREKKNGSHPRKADTDEDGLSDFEEVSNYDTDPASDDTDSDQLGDYEEIKNHGTDPSDAYSDSDGLDDGEEVLNYGTDPMKADTDDDALKDGEEVDLFAADPLRRDVFVEVDYISNAQSLSYGAISTLKSHFSNAPIYNPDGSWGVDLHIDVDDEIFRGVDTVEFSDKSGSYNDFGDFKDSYFTDERKDTHHYALLAKFVKSDGQNVGGVCSPYSNDFMVSTHHEIVSLFSYDWDEPVGDDYVGSTFMHELGHALGLTPSDFEGIDSWEYSFEDYPSAMNYNAEAEKSWLNELNYLYPFVDYYGYSHNHKFDDWTHLAKGFESP